MIVMTHKFLCNVVFKVLFGAFFLLSVFFAKGAQAQRCDIDYEVLYKLRNPQIGTYSVWKTLWGKQDRQEHFRSAVALQNLEVFAVGQREAHGSEPAKIVVAQIRKNGRVRWHKAYDLVGLTSVVRMLPRDDGYIVVANVTDVKKREAVWIGFFDVQGALLRTERVVRSGVNISAQDIIVLPRDEGEKGAHRKGGRRYMLATSVADRGAGRYGSTVFYVLSNKGRVLSHRGLVMGPENRILGMQALDDGGLLGVGYSYSGDGRKDGWIVRLDGDGVIKWQRQYPRGVGAQLVAGRALLSDAFVVTGTVGSLVPGGGRSGWAMAVGRDTGRVLWQRYFTGSLEFFGRDLLVSDDGVVSVMLDADVLEGSDEVIEVVKEVRDDGVLEEAPVLVSSHVRLMELNPQGVLLDGEYYFFGEGADAYQLVRGPNRERIIVGGTDMAYKIKGEGAGEGAGEGVGVSDDGLRRSRDGWLSVAVPVDVYDNPCTIKPYRAP